MCPMPRILEFTKQQVTASKRAVAESAKVIEISRERLASARKAISNSEAREQRHRERHEKQAA